MKLYTFQVVEDGYEDLFKMDVETDSGPEEAKETAVNKSKAVVEQIYPYVDEDDVWVDLVNIHVRVKE